MCLIDLTLLADKHARGQELFHTEELHIANQGGKYTGIIHQFQHNSMVGTYIDFPSHVRETDDGSDASNYPLDKLFRVRATVIHLDRQDGSGRVGADELAAACPGGAPGGALILNALGKKRFDEIASRSVYLGTDAVNWIVRQGIHLLVSDIYESDLDPQNVFPDLFRKGITTVCCPVNMHLLTEPEFRLTVLFPRFAGATQLACRVLVETGCRGWNGFSPKDAQDAQK